MRTRTMGRSPEIPWAHNAECSSVLLLSTSEDGRIEASEYNTELASLWNKWASSRLMPRWCSCTCACVQASANVRSNVAAPRYLSASSNTSSRVEATRVEKTTRAVLSGGMRTVRRRLTTGSSTEPTVFEGGLSSAIDTGLDRKST